MHGHNFRGGVEHCVGTRFW